MADQRRGVAGLRERRVWGRADYSWLGSGRGLVSARLDRWPSPAGIDWLPPGRGRPRRLTVSLTEPSLLDVGWIRPGRRGPVWLLGTEVAIPALAGWIGTAGAAKGSQQALARARPKGREVLNTGRAWKGGDGQTVSITTVLSMCSQACLPQMGQEASIFFGNPGPPHTLATTWARLLAPSLRRNDLPRLRAVS